jgi:peptidoglycan/xylan/chitin deacetylase (PgdA/CDA1 family)
MRAIPVFMYHHINWHEGDLVTLTPKDFENHLRVLQERNYRTIFLDQLVRILRRQESPSQPAVALTFDDGHLDNWGYAFPLLKKYQMKATVFVITSWMGEGEKRPQWNPDRRENGPEIPRHREMKKRVDSGDLSPALNWQEARAMEASGLVDIQSHTHFHRDYFTKEGKAVQLNPANREFLLRDLMNSRALIEDRLGKKCRFLAWPWGKYDEEAVLLAKKAGFEAVVTTEKGVNVPGSDAMAIKRVVAKSGDKRWFSSRLSIYSQKAVGHIYSRIAGKI